MLHKPIALPGPVSIEARGRRRADRAMDVLQYGTAFLAFVVAALLTEIR